MLIFLLSTNSSLFCKKSTFLKRTNANDQFFIFDGAKVRYDTVYQDQYVGNCYIRYNSTIWDLNPLSKLEKSYKIKTLTGGSVNLNFCDNIVSSCNNSTEGLVVTGGNNVKAFRQHPAKVQNLCEQYSNRWSFDKTWRFINDTTGSSLQLAFPVGDTCAHDAKQNYRIFVELKCNPAATGLKVLNDGTFNTNSCNNTIIAESAEACPRGNFFSWWNMTPLNKYIIAAILILVGSLFLIVGEKIFNFVAAVIVGAGGTIMVKSLVAPFYIMNIYVAIGFGVCLAIIFHFLAEWGFVILGGILGYFTGTFLYTIVLSFIPTVNPNIVYYASITICIIVVALLVSVIRSMVNILVTSVIGAYLFIRGISVIFKGFPDETYTSSLIEHFEFGQLKYMFGGKAIVYVIGMAIVAVVGVIIQLGMATSKKDGENTEAEKKTTENVETKAE